MQRNRPPLWVPAVMFCGGIFCMIAAYFAFNHQGQKAITFGIIALCFQLVGFAAAKAYAPKPEEHTPEA